MVIFQEGLYNSERMKNFDLIFWYMYLFMASIYLLLLCYIYIFICSKLNF